MKGESEEMERGGRGGACSERSAAAGQRPLNMLNKRLLLNKHILLNNIHDYSNKNYCTKHVLGCKHEILINMFVF